MNVENAIAHALKYLDGWKHQHEEAQKEPNLLERVELLHQAGNVYHRYEGAKSTLIELGVPREIFVEEEKKVFSK